MNTNLIGYPIKSKRYTLLRINTPLKGTHNTLQADNNQRQYHALNRFKTSGLNCYNGNPAIIQNSHYSNTVRFYSKMEERGFYL